MAEIRTSFGAFTALCAGAAKALGVPSSEFRKDQLLFAAGHRRAAARLSELGLPEVCEVSLGFVNPGWMGWLDSRWDVLAGSLGCKDSMERGAHGRKHMGSGSDASMMQKFKSSVEGILPAELEDPERGQLLRFPKKGSPWVASMAELAGGKSGAYRMLSGHESWGIGYGRGGCWAGWCARKWSKPPPCFGRW